MARALAKRAHWAKTHVSGLVVILLLAGAMVTGAVGMAFAVETEDTNDDSNSASYAQNENQNDSRIMLNLGEDNVINTQQLPDSSFIYDTTIADLATADTYMDGQTVQIVGEVVGDRIQAEADSDHSWLVLADEKATTVSVYLETEDADLVDTYGRYNQQGTYLQVRGIFNLICSDHQGQTDIHAEYVSVTQKGKVTTEQIVFSDFLPGIFLTACGILLFVLFNLLRERRR